MQLFFRIFLIFMFLCSAFLIKSENFAYNKNVFNSLIYISETKQETVSQVKEEKYYIVSNNQNKTEINNLNNKNKHIGFAIGCTIFNQKNILNKFVIYKNKLSFKYLIYKILNNLRNSIYARAP